MKRTGPPQRKTRLRQRGRKALRTEQALYDFRVTVAARAEGMCEARTPACPPGEHPGTDCHHIWPSDRDKGLHNPDRGVLLCRSGHSWAHDHPAEARERGLLLREGDER